jgi:hypothetical protein
MLAAAQVFVDIRKSKSVVVVLFFEKSCVFSGRCNPSCIAALTAIELIVGDVSVEVVIVGNGHMDKIIMAWTVDSLYGGLDISAHRSFITHSDRTGKTVTSSRYRRDATPMIAQKRMGPDL